MKLMKLGRLLLGKNKTRFNNPASKVAMAVLGYLSYTALFRIPKTKEGEQMHL